MAYLEMEDAKFRNKKIDEEVLALADSSACITSSNRS